jgi:hypothetical protein
MAKYLKKRLSFKEGVCVIQSVGDGEVEVKVRNWICH